MLIDFQIYNSAMIHPKTGLTFRIGYGNRKNRVDWAIKADDIVITELAFSICEDIFFHEQHPYAHWGITYLNKISIEKIVVDLNQRISNIKSHSVSPAHLIHPISEEEKIELQFNIAQYIELSIQFISAMIDWINTNHTSDGITIFGV